MSKESIWIDAILRDAPDYLRARDPQALRARADAWVALQLDRCQDPEFAATFEQHCPVAGCAPDAYLQRELEIGPGVRVLAGIRFRGTAVEFPFVDVVASTMPWRACLARLRDGIRSEFASFAPLAIRVVDGIMVASAVDGESVDQYFHAAEASEMLRSEAAVRATSDPAEMLEIVDRDGVDACFDFMQIAYREFAEDDASLAALVFASDRAQLAECVETGLLCYILDEGERAGILGVAKSTDWLFEGLCVYDEILRRAHRGGGLAAVAQVQLARLLIDRQKGDLVWGTIADVNRASRKTATRAGRAARGVYRFLEL